MPLRSPGFPWLVMAVACSSSASPDGGIARNGDASFQGENGGTGATGPLGGGGRGGAGEATSAAGGANTANGGVDATEGGRDVASGGASGSERHDGGDASVEGTHDGGPAATTSFFIGADITDQEPAPAAAQDALLAQMKAHGFNFVRLRTFVDPTAADGYDKTNGYDDIAHTALFAKRIKAANLGLLIDFHYSDNWADPGKQCIPVAWQSYATLDELATAVHDYTKDAITQLVDGGARPDMVQIGNEITPGMLLDHCDANGLPITGVNVPLAGRATSAGWPILGALLNAGARGVEEVDAGIVVALHIDRGNDFSTSKDWIDGAVRQGVSFDAFGESCYQKYQGDPNSVANTVNGWTTTFARLVATYPRMKFFAAEYGPLERQINDVLFDLPGERGLGTFDWQPTTEGDWNADTLGGATHALFERSGDTYVALPDLALFDAMKVDYAGRL